MKKRSLRLGLSLLPLVLCACTQDWSGGLESARLSKGDAETFAVAAQAPSVDATSVSQRRRDSAFADYPDTGSLVHYAAKVAPRRTGAYTWHAVDLSEEHAFRAMASGELTFQAPDGTPIKLAYQRHIEHPDGNWSWVGEAADGQTSVITFGEEAVFGTIPQGDGQPPLRLTLADGRAWVVSADKQLLAQIHNEATHPTSPDYLIPPRRVQAAGAASGGRAAMAAPATAEASSSATTVIDVLVGYTNGFAAARGSQSAAQTRIRNLVDITNQAYVSSQIDAELRLVHSMQVTFPDNTANEDALEKLTGFRAPSTQLTPDPAFKDLRQARETYGADLVALVRKFNDPENDGCGIAWLLGGGESGITPSDEYFGYSVVSDGQDVGNDGKTYFCREETFAHEIGHNLGSQHDIETSKDDDGTPQPGAYAYSYGYKTGSSQGNFYTIMAYGDSGQTGYRVFSNPNITNCGGRACGTATANNARSINNTDSIIAAFRASVVANDRPAHNDIDGDGKSDVLLFRPGKFAYLIMDGYVVKRSKTLTVPSGWSIVATGHFNKDALVDLVLRDQGGRIYFWQGNGSTFTSVSSLAVSLSYSVVGAGDIDLDGDDDLILHRPGQVVRFSVENGAVVASSAFSVPVDQVPMAVGSFSAGSRADLVARSSSGGVYIWTTMPTGYSYNFIYNLGSAYQIFAAADVDGDDGDDLLLFRSGQIVQWVFDGTQLVRSSSLSLSTSYEPRSTGRLTGEGSEGIVLQHLSNNSLYALLPVAGGGYTSKPMIVPASGFKPVP